MKRFLSICIFLCGCYSGSGQSAGDSLFAEGQYLEAAVAYEKDVFFATNRSAVAGLLLKKSYCYKALGDYHEALETANRITRMGEDSTRQLVMYERILLNYLKEDYRAANGELLRWELKFKEVSPSVLNLKFLTLVGLGEMQQAEQLVLDHYAHFNISSASANTLFPGKLNWKDPEKAYKISLFLPGVGQMYAGSFFKGLVSGGVQAGLIAFTAFNVYHGYFFTGGMTGAALFYTFYLGGARHARELAEAKNEGIKLDIKRRFLELVKK